MPLYYRLNLISIYGYLEQRFGTSSYKTGAAFFILSRTIGSAFRLFLVVVIMQQFILAPLGIPFWMTGALAIALILIYTFRGGIKTIVWTDTLQTVCMLGVVALTIGAIIRSIDLSWNTVMPAIQELRLNKVFHFSGGWQDPNNFFKQVISGALITIVMTGLDQDMMQKNLTCKNIGDAQKNMFVFCIILVLANVLFLLLGALLYVYAAHEGIAIPDRTDQLFPMIAMEYLPPVVAFLFVLGLTAMVYSSVDSTLAALTTAFCVDFLNFKRRETYQDQKTLMRVRRIVHIGFAGLLFVVILIFNSLNNDAVINELFAAAGYTYGPLLGLFTFGLFTKRKLNDKWAPVICLLAPVISWMLNEYNHIFLNGFELGFLILAVNGLLTFGGLWLISRR
jgi:Na+/proline symporter